MRVELYIGGELIETIVLNIPEKSVYEHRNEQVNGAVNWLNYKYKATLIIKPNWEMILVAPSKMNDGTGE